MPTDFDELMQSVRNAEQQYQTEMKRIGETISHLDFDCMETSMAQQLREVSEFSQKQAQAPFDTADTLKQLVQMIEDDRAEREADAKIADEQDRKQKRIEHIQFWATFIATIIGSAAAVGGLIATIVLS